MLALPLVLAVALGLMVFTANHSDAAAKKAAQRNAKVVKAVKVAKKQIGDPYRRGGTGPNGFDCSGLTQYSFKKAGINIPRTSGSQSNALRKISKSKMKRGDLIYFTRGGRVYHAAIYLGKKNGHKIMLHSSRPGTPVRVNRIFSDSYQVRTLRL
ncbi:C40 family peptidase [Solicola sp. PLA-1-18]|uniref:C40 family peptidase n=1 Tax=Solicola sp. PLA-1-18 TaxID=3380532 RepID=UPI003B811CDB